MHFCLRLNLVGMKRFILALLLIPASISGYSQDAPKTCFEKWEAVFKKRGADPVGDGMHRNVIVSVEDATGTACFFGKARVEYNRVTQLWIMQEDDDYRMFDNTKFAEERGAMIENGISKVWVGLDEKKYRVVFVERIKPKPQEFKLAPDPEEMLNDL